ncbi:type II toxin-antitoxin system RelE/ParE family toxin [bacterium]|nr:type II toxin-antitoxin system RelE/ParE family toxin [bacterium]
MENISDYIAKDNRKAAICIVDIFYETFKFLSDYPEAGSKKNDIKDNSIRIFTVKKNFCIVYRIRNNKIEILRILTRF